MGGCKVQKHLSSTAWLVPPQKLQTPGSQGSCPVGCAWRSRHTTGPFLGRGRPRGVPPAAPAPTVNVEREGMSELRVRILYLERKLPNVYTFSD